MAHGIVDERTAVVERAFALQTSRRGLRAQVQIGQTWRRRRDKRCFRVRQVHVADKQVELENGAERVMVPYGVLRTKWRRVTA